MLKVTVEGVGAYDIRLKPGERLLDAAVAVMLILPDVPVPSLHLSDAQDSPCEFLAFDPSTGHLTIRVRKK